MSKRAVNLLRNMAVPFKRDATNPNYGYHKVISAAAAKTLTHADSGAIIYWTQSNAHDITLPAAKAGVCFTFHIVAGSAHNHYIVTEAADVVYGKAVVDGYWFVNADLHTTGASIASVVVFQD